MLVVYDSKTGNVKRFASKLRMECIQIHDGLKVDKPYVLITYTTGVGQVPPTTLTFLEANSHLLQGVSASGNMNWGTRFGLAGDLISAMYEVPLLTKFELSGTMNDVARFEREVNQIVHTSFQMDTA